MGATRPYLVGLLLVFVSLWVVACTAGSNPPRPNGGGQSIGLPHLEPKPYQIAIAPSHITVSPNPLFEPNSPWGQVAKKVDLYKYQGGQLRKAYRGAGTTFDVKPFVEFMKRHGIQIGVDFGSFKPPGCDVTLQNIQATFERAVMSIDPVFKAGGEVTSIHLDGPEARTLKGSVRTRKCSGGGVTLNQYTDSMLAFWRKVHGTYPRMKIGLIVNLPTWNYTADLPGCCAANSEGTGLTYHEILDALHRTLAQGGERIDFLEIDNPYNYFALKRNRAGKPLNIGNTLLAIQKWCKENRVRFHLIVNADGNINKGGGPGVKSKAFRDLTLKYIRELRNSGIFPDIFVIQSWFKWPDRNLPESDPNTFTGTAKASIQLIEELYPKK